MSVDVYSHVLPPEQGGYFQASFGAWADLAEIAECHGAHLPPPCPSDNFDDYALDGEEARALGEVFAARLADGSLDVWLDKHASPGVYVLDDGSTEVRTKERARAEARQYVEDFIAFLRRCGSFDVR